MPEIEKQLPNLEAVVTVRYQVPKSMPPVFRQISKGSVFLRNDLPETDIVHMLRQGTVSATDKAVGPPPAQAEETPSAAAVDPLSAVPVKTSSKAGAEP